MQTRTLGDPDVRAQRLARLHEPHIAPLTALAERTRRTPDPHALYWAPYFDPASGGTRAQVLLLLESPGPQVSVTQVVSVDNPDGTAENVACLLHLSGLGRGRVLLSNSFPWQLSAKQVVTPTDANLLEAMPVTLELLSLLPELRVVVLVGRRAERAWAQVTASAPPSLTVPLTILACPHPSPVNFNLHPGASTAALDIFVQAGRLAKGGQ